MTIYVNWAEVLKDTPVYCVLANLCSGNPEYLRGILSIKYRYQKYFTTNKPEVVELETLLRRLKNASNIQIELDEILRKYPIPYIFREFWGECYGFCSNVPCWMDEKNKVFSLTTKQVRNSIQYEEIDWVVLYATLSYDPATIPPKRYVFMMAPSAVFQPQPSHPPCFEFDGQFVETASV